ncbi:MAG: hypothetical protein PHD65_12355 [Gallionella sp.]|nr:hypothetical protein [Gallionella sp.]
MAESMIGDQRFCRGCAAQSCGMYRIAANNLLSFCGVVNPFAMQSPSSCKFVGRRLVNNTKQVVGYIFCLLFSAFCHAEELPDPTRPPAIIAISAATTGRGAPSGLQSVIISKTRRAAIIDGETVELKGKHGDATLIEVSETGVVLQGAQGRQVLTLFPDVRIMQKEIQAAPQLSIKEGGLAQKTRLEARKERK